MIHEIKTEHIFPMHAMRMLGCSVPFKRTILQYIKHEKQENKT